MTLDQSPQFFIGCMYSNEEIQQGLAVGNASGVRVSVSGNRVNRIVIMTSVPDIRQERENPYHDRKEGDILVYTGAGLEGEQSLAGVNKRIPQQLTDNFPIYCFEIIGSRRDRSTGPKRWRFLGLLEYLRHYPDIQLDSRGTVRKVWLFEFRIHQETTCITPQNELSISHLILKESRQQNPLIDNSQIHPAQEINQTTDSLLSPSELERIRRSLLAKQPRDFELFIKELMIATGHEKVVVTKFSQDGGIDINAYPGPKMWAIENMLIQIQAKRWLHTVGRKEVAELRGSLQPFARGAIVTTSHYSKSAISEACSPGKTPIVLIDGYALARIVKTNNIKFDLPSSE